MLLIFVVCGECVGYCYVYEVCVMVWLYLVD